MPESANVVIMLLNARLGLIIPSPSTVADVAVVLMALFLYMASMSIGTASTSYSRSSNRRGEGGSIQMVPVVN